MNLKDIVMKILKMEKDILAFVRYEMQRDLSEYYYGHKNDSYMLKKVKNTGREVILLKLF